MAYTSGYLIVFGAIMVAVVVIARVAGLVGRVLDASRCSLPARPCCRRSPSCPCTCPTAASRELGMVRSIETVTEFSATLKGYLAAAGRIHFSTWSAGFWDNPVDAFFPGFVVIVLAMAAIDWTVRRARPGRGRSPEPLLARAAGSSCSSPSRLTGVLLSLGTRTPVYGWVYQRVPADAGTARRSTVRQPVPARPWPSSPAFGLAGLRRRLPARRAGLIVVASRRRSPTSSRCARRFSTRDSTASRRSTRCSRKSRDASCWSRSRSIRRRPCSRTAPYVLNSTAHWRPLMNGYSGYIPERVSRVRRDVLVLSRRNTPSRRCGGPA